MKTETRLRVEICNWGRSLFERGLTGGSSGNLTVKLADGGFLATPTNSCLGMLEAERLSRLGPDGTHISGDKPTKEVSIHMAFYAGRPQVGAVVHLHSTYATALSCVADIDPADVLPPITPYAVMRLGRVPLLPYRAPGADAGLRLQEAAAHHPAVLLANHGPVVSGTTLEAAVFAAEELEETARLSFVLHGRSVRRLSPEHIAELEANLSLRGQR